MLGEDTRTVSPNDGANIRVSAIPDTMQIVL